MRLDVHSPVAIIGMACRLPGAGNLDEFWQLVRAGRRAWGPVPAERFDRELYFSPEKGVRGKSYSDLGGLVSYGPLDRGLCPLSQAQIATHDPAHLTLCEVAAAACRQAGMDPAALPHRNTGVYVGHARASGTGGDLTYAAYIPQVVQYFRDADDFRQLPEDLGNAALAEVVQRVRGENPHLGPDGSPFTGASLAAGLISRTFDLSGPSMVFNAACASSLYALIHAARALQAGRIEMAMVGGASYFHSDTLVMFSQAQSVTARGSYPFSDEADGMVVAEGYVVLLLKTLAQALADGNTPLAVIHGIGISSDGHGKSLWAPRQEGQIRAMQRAYGSQASLGRLQYLEAHATSTALGDATELEALGKVLDGQLPAGRKIALGSVKGNIGHTLETAGLASLAKTVLALRHGVIPPASDGRKLNTKVDWERLPVEVPTEAREWPAPEDGHPRRAGVSAFGIGGLNVHVVLDEFPVVQASRLQDREQTSRLLGTGESISRGLSQFSSDENGTVPLRSATVVSSPVLEGEQARRLHHKAPHAEPIAVIGMGAVLPGARTIEAFWDLLVSGRDCRLPVPPDRWDSALYLRGKAADSFTTPTVLGGFIDDFQYDWRKHRIPPKQIAQASPLQFMILDAVDQALETAGYRTRPLARERAGVVVGTVFGGDFSAQLSVGLHLTALERTVTDVLRGRGVAEDLLQRIVPACAEAVLKRMPALLDETGSFTASALASRITKTLDLMGGGVALDAGAASSLAAIYCAVDLLLAGDCDSVFCVAGQQAMTPLAYAAWSAGGMLASGRAAPFDAEADGVVPGEGAGVLLLKRLADARRDGDPVYGILRGIGAGFAPCRDQAAQWAMRRALESAGVETQDVLAIETAGTGRLQNDAQELRAIAEVYAPGALTRSVRSTSGDLTRSVRSTGQPMLLGTLAGQIGYPGGASGMASLLKAVLALGRREMPGTAGVCRPAPFVSRWQPHLIVPSTLTSLAAAADGHEQMVAVTSCGGTEAVYHAILQRGDAALVAGNVPCPGAQSQNTPTAPEKDNTMSKITYFDATARRREKMRQKAAAAQAVHAAQETVQPATIPAAAPEVAPQETKTEPAAVAPTPAPPAPAALDEKELESFLVNFVVEQTGYPPEIVELDADLEADLGIDSLKKAQLFAELGEQFHVPPAENLSLDDFPTLRHVRDYLWRATGGAAGAQTAPKPAAEAVPLPPAPPTVPAKAASPVPPQASSVAITAAQAAKAAAPAGKTNGEASGTSVAPVAAPGDKELESYLVNFVVEQTGYPPEIVELDADLEADLGIDSLKKAQLFAELGEHFHILPAENLSLDDFPTLRHVLAYLLTNRARA